MLCGTRSRLNSSTLSIMASSREERVVGVNFDDGGKGSLGWLGGGTKEWKDGIAFHMLDSFWLYLIHAYC